MTPQRREMILRHLARQRERREHGEGRQFGDLTWGELVASAHAAMVLAEADMQGDEAFSPDSSAVVA